ncbi:DUF190 domain-containing protein [Streptomyces cinnamoneus]|uniref:DUF190 domain-containing protein n=1 Tax=Streptomyces cinnamoneus TaxID=53446 RepID=UPI00343C9547
MTPYRLVPAARLVITVLNGALWQRKPLHAELVRRAHRYGLSSTAVFQGIEGYGADGVIHTSRLLSLSDRLPLLVVATDEEPRIRGFLEALDPGMDLESVVIQQVQTVEFRSPEGAPRP